MKRLPPHSAGCAGELGTAVLIDLDDRELHAVRPRE